MYENARLWPPSLQEEMLHWRLPPLSRGLFSSSSLPFSIVAIGLLTSTFYQVCNNKLRCRNHRCEATCHSGNCLPCPLMVDIPCYCKATVIRVPCGMESSVEPPKCRKACRIPPSCHHQRRKVIVILHRFSVYCHAEGFFIVPSYVLIKYYPL